jgi:hypothetical protein
MYTPGKHKRESPSISSSAGVAGQENRPQRPFGPACNSASVLRLLESRLTAFGFFCRSSDDLRAHLRRHTRLRIAPARVPGSVSRPSSVPNSLCLSHLTVTERGPRTGKNRLTEPTRYSIIYVSGANIYATCCAPTASPVFSPLLPLVLAHTHVQRPPTVWIWCGRKSLMF